MTDRKTFRSRLLRLACVALLAAPTACGGDDPPANPSPVVLPVAGMDVATTGDGDTTPTTGDGDTAPTTGDGDTTPTTGDGDTAPATGDGDTTPATGDGDSTPATGDGDTTPTTGDGDTAPTTGDGDTTPTTGDGDGSDLEHFSFFVTSLEIMQELSGSQDGFGGDLGGLSGADDICQQAADRVGFGAKTWRAFLSATDGGNGSPVHAIDRIGEGPWYDRNGRLIAEDRAGLLAGDRPAGDDQAVNDLPNEFGEGLKAMGDTHDIMTGTNAQGQLDSTDAANTCNDWTSTTATPTGGRSGGMRLGHSWPARSGTNWMAVHSAHSCAPGVNLVQNGGGDGSSVGAGGGWGGIYCFALTP